MFSFAKCLQLFPNKRVKQRREMLLCFGCRKLTDYFLSTSSRSLVCQRTAFLSTQLFNTLLSFLAAEDTESCPPWWSTADFCFMLRFPNISLPRDTYAGSILVALGYFAVSIRLKEKQLCGRVRERCSLIV